VAAACFRVHLDLIAWLLFSDLLGKDAAGLSALAIGRLKDGWFDEYAAWQKRDLSAKRYVYIWGRWHPSRSPP
jgi:hypothetical protein